MSMRPTRSASWNSRQSQRRCRPSSRLPNGPCGGTGRSWTESTPGGARKFLLKGFPRPPAAPLSDRRHDRGVHVRGRDGCPLEAQGQRSQHGGRVVARPDRGLIMTGPDRPHGLRRLARHLAGNAALAHGDGAPQRDLAATIVFAIAAGAGHADYVDGVVSGGSLVLTLAGLVVMAVGGWLGGAIVFVHGMRVLSLVDEPSSRAALPIPSPEKEGGAEGRSQTGLGLAQMRCTLRDCSTPAEEQHVHAHAHAKSGPGVYYTVSARSRELFGKGTAT